jgi:hypothetical protein
MNIGIIKEIKIPTDKTDYVTIFAQVSFMLFPPYMHCVENYTVVTVVNVGNTNY